MATGASRTTASGTGVFAHEEILAWNHLTAAGFMNGSYTPASGATDPADDNTPKNPYSVYVQLIYDGVYGAQTGITKPAKHNLKTGGQVPVEIIAEVDRKIDDGKPDSGGFQFSMYDPNTNNPAIDDCTAAGQWNISVATTNCGGASLF